MPGGVNPLWRSVGLELERLRLALGSSKAAKEPIAPMFASLPQTSRSQKADFHSLAVRLIFHHCTEARCWVWNFWWQQHPGSHTNPEHLSREAGKPRSLLSMEWTGVN